MIWRLVPMAKSILKKLKEAESYDRIYVKWVDADVSNPGWEELNLKEELSADGIVETNGFYMGHDHRWLIVAFSIDKKNENINVTTRIPIKWIEELELG